ncbi:hypothetical protein L916_02201 [Phytophthora nicotianae]|uniref:Uncharacterized protein n=1 Tax=Phytophthora nicotianae TaxID=4792 RepID=W2JP04_PHYNI|nr:hypothetical protein L916_02201 [Phytophthora nicotianae]
MAVQLPYGVGWIIGNFMIVELAGGDNEGRVYGLITMVANLSSPFAQALTLVINQPLNLTTARIQADDISILFLPPEKAETQELLRTGGSSKILGGLTVFYVMFALCGHS